MSNGTSHGSRFENKVVLVTGGTSGIGHETALRLVKEGASVAFTGRREDRGREVESELNGIRAGAGFYIKADHANEADNARAVDETVAKFGRLDGAFNNAGVEGELAPTTDQTKENYEKVFGINVFGVLASMKHEVPAMLKTGGGSIVNTSSVAGRISMAGLGVYSASKHAVEGLTKGAALEFSKEGVRVNSVAPAAIETEMYDRFTGGDEGAQEQFKSFHPIGRVGNVGEVADAVLFLLSDESSFVTGQSLAVDGAFLAQ